MTPLTEARVRQIMREEVAVHVAKPLAAMEERIFKRINRALSDAGNVHNQQTTG